MPITIQSDCKLIQKYGVQIGKPGQKIPLQRVRVDYKQGAVDCRRKIFDLKLRLWIFFLYHLVQLVVGADRRKKLTFMWEFHEKIGLFLLGLFLADSILLGGTWPCGIGSFWHPGTF